MTTRRQRILPPLLLVLAMIVTLVMLNRPLVRGDGLAYLVWIDTLVLDRDINLNNQHDRFREVNTYQIQWNDDQQRWVNIFPFGIAIPQTPFYLLGAVMDNVLNANPDYFRQMQGVGQSYSLWLMIGANVMAVIAALCAYGIGWRVCGRWLAALIAYAVFVGTPLVYYSTITPVNSHNPGAFALAVFLLLLARGTDAFSDQPRPAHLLIWVALGVFAGLTVLSRWQLAVAVAPAWLLLLYERRWRGVIVATLAAGLTVLPLPLVWNAMFGSPFLVPFDAVSEGEFMQREGNQALRVFGALIVHSPVVVLSLAGLPFLWRMNRRWAVLLAVMIVLQLIVNGAALDWNAGESYGMRRMSELYAVYVVLACAFAGGVIQWAVKRGRERVVRYGVSAVFAGIVVYSAVYMATFMVFSWHNPARLFSDSPDVMIGYFVDLSHRWQILWEIYRTHAGPLSWALPGP